jgi:glycine/D-amino acid oxidase-like deaminating enzyme
MNVTHHPLALPPSLYADTAVAPVPTPPLDIDKTVSVAIIGGGFAGLSTALHLAEQGTEALMLEAQQPGWGASGNNGGQLNPGLKLDPDTVEATFGTDLGRRMIAFSYNTPVFTLDLIRRLRIECEARQNGTLRAAYHPSSTAGVETTAEQCIRRGMPVTLLGRDAVREATGTDRYLLAMRDARGGDVQPLSYARGLVRAVLAGGAAVHGETPASLLRREGGRWIIETPRAVVRAEKVLIATNGFTDDLWPDLRRTIVPVFSSIAATEPLPDEVARKIMPTRSVLYESGHITVYYRVDASNRLLMGGRGPMQWIKDPAPVSYLIPHALRGTALAENPRRALDARLEQPARDDAGSLPACARTRRRCAGLSRLQRPRRRARNRDGTATRETADRGREGRDRHADYRPEAHSFSRIVAGGRKERSADGPDPRPPGIVAT